MKIILLAPLAAVLASYPRLQVPSYGYFNPYQTVEVTEAPAENAYQIPKQQKFTNAPTPSRWSKYSYRDLVIDELPPTPSLEDLDLKDPNENFDQWPSLESDENSDEGTWPSLESDENSGEAEDLPSLEESDENNP